MATHRSTWKARERQAAALFGARRNRCSGSSGRDDESRSDSTHDRIFLETKLRQHHAVQSLFDETRILARRENKLPVLALATKGKPSFLLVLAPEDLKAVAAEMVDGDPFFNPEIPLVPKSIASDDADLSTPTLFPGDSLK